MEKIVQTLSVEIEGSYDALSVYRALRSTARPGPGALLETACIHSREHTQSILMLSAGLKIVCRDFTITIKALNANGLSALDGLLDLLPAFERHGASLIYKLPRKTGPVDRDEHKRLLDLSIMEPLQRLMEIIKSDDLKENISSMFIGCFSFELLNQFEDNKFAEEKHRNYPDYSFYFADQLLLINHKNGSAELVSKVFTGNEQQAVLTDYQNQLSLNSSILKDLANHKATPLTYNDIDLATTDYKTNLTDDEYIEKVELIKKHVIAGDIFQAVFARQFSLPCYDAMIAYEILRQQNPSPYMFFIESEDYHLFGASPESAVKVSALANKVSIYPIAGTRRRGFTKKGTIDPDLDTRLEVDLLADTKEMAEHMMLVDLARNDIARISKAGSRRIERLMQVDRYSHVMHLVSKVSGELKDKVDCFTAYRACMNMGTLTGAPKLRASEFIAKYETVERGPYGGAVGYINACGDMDTAIVIRSALVKVSTATVSAGAGIVFDSDPQSEADETRIKAQAVLRAIITANQISSVSTSTSREVA